MVNNIGSNIINLSLPDKISNLSQRLAQVEARFSDMGYDFRNVVQTELKSSFRVPAQAETINSLHTAICMETIDPMKQGRVRFFSPLLHDFNTPVKALPWAYPISSQGGFDDSGCTWVPPAGSKLCVLFEAGNRSLAYYIGTAWDRDRSEGWGIAIEEYEKIHRGHRGGYLLGEDETQVFPPWNTENYNGNDIDSIMDFENDPNAKNKITYPNIYGWKTPQKHMIKMVDGNYKCNFRWQRLEIKSAQGNHIILKDDKVHPTAQWAHPSCGCGGGDASYCNDGDTPIEKLKDCPADANKSSCANPYFKHKNECKPYQGPQNCQNNKVDKETLPQSGVQIISLSGHTMWMDDSVAEPKGTNEWENSIRPFDYGCPEGDGVFKGKTAWKSAHGHQIVMSDVEPDGKPRLRGDENFIKILTATGNRIELNDDTTSCKCTCENCGCGSKCGADNAGPKRGITMQSTSNHTIEMIDENNKQCSPNRKEGGTPKNEATDAFVRIRTGYGLEMHMGDDNSQKETQQQYIQIMAPQYDSCCGPHMIRMQEDPNCGYIFVRAAGDYICMTEGDHYTVVGVGKSTGEFCDGGCLGPRNWFTAVSKHSLHYSCNFYFNKAEIHAFLADKMILLLAGKDCPPPPGGEECGPCVGPVAVLVPTPKGPQLKASDRVYASSSIAAPCISLFMLSPFVKCNTTPSEECE